MGWMDWRGKGARQGLSESHDSHESHEVMDSIRMQYWQPECKEGGGGKELSRRLEVEDGGVGRCWFGFCKLNS